MTSEHPTLSLIIPVYNEGELLLKTLPAFLKWLENYPATSELILVTDGSGPSTLHIVSDFVAQTRHRQRSPAVTWIRHPENRGKGSAVRSGASRAFGEVIAFADADGSLPITELNHLLRAISEGADVAIASRRCQGADPLVTSPGVLRSLPGWLLNRYAQFYFTPGIRDTQCGLKAYRRKVLQVILPRSAIHRFAFDIEWLALSLRHGFTVREIGIRWIPRNESSVRIISDGMQALRDLLALKRRLLN
ncbi:MAG: glycosyltransferase [bacterium JZ-2024 1]